VIAEFADGSGAILANKFGKGTVVTILPSAEFSVGHFPELVRDALDFALAASGNQALIDVVGANENIETAFSYTEKGFDVALVNHGDAPRLITLKSSIGNFNCARLPGDSTRQSSSRNLSLQLNLAAGDSQMLECRFSDYTPRMNSGASRD
jgi:hypothetical protein